MPRFARRGLLLALFCTMLVVGASAASASSSGAASGSTRQVSASGTAGFGVFGPAADLAGIENPEIAGGGDGAGPADRSHSGAGSTPVGAVSQPKQLTLSNPGLVTSFDGLDHFDNRFGTTSGGNQFSLVPPDGGMCVGSDGHGNTRVLETLNDVTRVFSTDGTAVTTPTALNAFFGYPLSINRTTGTLGQFVTDPSCIYDAQTGRWFMDVLTIDSFPHVGDDGLQHFTGTNHIDLAVSNTSDPTGSWNIYRIPVQDDGTQGTPDHHCTANTNTSAPLPTNPNACLGDYPHIGTDANGVYITTNEYSLFGVNFIGAQIYAFSKAKLVSQAPTVNVTQINTHGLDHFGFGLNGFTLWPSQTPGGGGDPSSGGTEYFMSSNAAAEAHDTGDGTSKPQPSTQLLVWGLTNTSSLNSATPTVSLSNAKLDVGVYAPPPQADQKSGPQPLRDCLNNNPCSLTLEGIKDPFAEKASNLDANDSRMQQVTWVNGKLWGALDTGLNVSSSKQAGVEWFEASPSTAAGQVTATLANQGYVALGNDNLTYPAIGITSGGTGVMSFTVVGSDFYPSAGYATVTNDGVGPVHIAAQGAGPEDDFSDYKLFGDPPGTVRPRWGDYSAAAPFGSNVWLEAEYVGQSCNLSQYENSNFRCGGTRTALANWDTRISQVAAP